MTALDPRPRSLDADASVLVDAALDGDELAWSLLCDRFAGQVRGVAAARVRDIHAVEDIVQDTFLRAWTRLHQLEDPERVGAWLKTIAANVAIDHLRALRPTASLDNHVEQIIHFSPLEDHVVEREAAAMLHERLGDLREADRVALWKRDALGASVSEVADELGMTAGSVRVLLTRARGKVRAGYGALVIPVLGLAGRLRTRLAGLGESLPAALVAPVFVVAAVTGIALPAMIDDAPTDETPIASGIVASVPVSATDSWPTEARASSPITQAQPLTPVAVTRTGPTTSPTPTNTDAQPASPVLPDDAAIATGNGAGFTSGDATRDDEPEVETGPQLPLTGVESLDLYVEDEPMPGESESAATCVLCD